MGRGRRLRGITVYVDYDIQERRIVNIGAYFNEPNCRSKSWDLVSRHRNSFRLPGLENKVLNINKKLPGLNNRVLTSGDLF